MMTFNLCIPFSELRVCLLRKFFFTVVVARPGLSKQPEMNFFCPRLISRNSVRCHHNGFVLFGGSAGYLTDSCLLQQSSEPLDGFWSTLARNSIIANPVGANRHKFNFITPYQSRRRRRLTSSFVRCAESLPRVLTSVCVCVCLQTGKFPARSGRNVTTFFCFAFCVDAL